MVKRSPARPTAAAGPRSAPATPWQRHHCETGINKTSPTVEQPLRAVPLDQPSVGAALDGDQHQPDTEKDRCRRRFGQAETTVTEQRERCLERGESDDRDEADDGQVTKDRRRRRCQLATMNPTFRGDESREAG